MSEEKPGPPPVIAQIRLNGRSPPISDRITTVVVAGRSSAGACPACSAVCTGAMIWPAKGAPSIQTVFSSTRLSMRPLLTPSSYSPRKPFYV